MTTRGQFTLLEEEPVPADADFIVYSSSRSGRRYPMRWTPDGLAVHVYEGCESEVYNGVLSCKHSKENEMTNGTTALVKAEGVLTPAPIEFTPGQLELIKTTIAKGATDDELQLFVATCRRTGLDPFMRQIYAIKRWDSREKKEVMGIQVGIDGLRLVAERTGRYGGQDAIEWLDTDGVWSQVWTGNGDYPVAARCTVYRSDVARGFPAVARWDSYAQVFSGKLGSMWEKMPDVMLGKCAESLALRRAFPAEMSGLAAAVDHDYDAVQYADELEQATPQQMHYVEGQVVSHDEHGERQQVEKAGSAPPIEQSAAGAPVASPPQHEDRQQEQGGVSSPTSPPTDSPAAAANRGPAASSPAKAPTTITEYRSYWWAAIEGHGLQRDDVENTSQQQYGNRVPGQLTPTELRDLAKELGVNVPLPGQAELI